MSSIARTGDVLPVPANQVHRPWIDRGSGSNASVRRLRPRLASSAERATKWPPFFVHHDARRVDCDNRLLSPASSAHLSAPVTPAMLPGLIRR